MKKVENLVNLTPENLESELFRMGYLKHNTKSYKRDGYVITTSGTKWLVLLQYIFKKHGMYKIIEPMDIIDAIHNCTAKQKSYYTPKKRDN
jgi:hypothetical protein